MRRAAGTPGLTLQACSDRGSRPPARSALTLVTDPEGLLCARVSRATPSSSLELHYPGSALLLPASTRVNPQRVGSARHLQFEVPSLELDLGEPAHRIRLIATGAESAERLPRIALSLHEADREIRLDATQWRREGPELGFTLSSDELGAPGPARLRAQMAGDDRAAAMAEAVVLRVARVQLEAEISSRDADVARVHVRATSALGPPPGGTVEALAGARSVASSPLHAGSAELSLPLSDGRAVFSLRYEGAEPWWLSGASLELALDAAPSTQPRHWPWLALLVPIGWVCWRALQRPAPRKARNRRRPPPVPRARPADAPPVAGWSGVVLDAHEGSPIGGAVVEITLPSLRPEAPRLTAESDAEGRFTLSALPGPVPEGARLRVSAPLHTEVERPLPPQGRVEIAMSSRRRTLLRRLVRWARAMGPPWNRDAEPTPREIANVALRRGHAETAHWAEAIEAAVFGASIVDRHREASLRAQEPPEKDSGRSREARDKE